MEREGGGLRETDRQTHRRTDTLTGTETDRQKDRQTDRQTDTDVAKRRGDVTKCGCLFIADFVFTDVSATGLPNFKSLV